MRPAKKELVGRAALARINTRSLVRSRFTIDSFCCCCCCCCFWELATCYCPRYDRRPRSTFLGGEMVPVLVVARTAGCRQRKPVVVRGVLCAAALCYGLVAFQHSLDFPANNNNNSNGQLLVTQQYQPPPLSPPLLALQRHGSSSSSSSSSTSVAGLCVVVGLFSRGSEDYDVRQWQRGYYTAFRRDLEESTSLKLRLRFPVVVVPHHHQEHHNDTSTTEEEELIRLQKEQKFQGDLVLLVPSTADETYQQQWGTSAAAAAAATLEFLKVAVDLFDDSMSNQSCIYGRYVVWADASDVVVLSYENLLGILRAVPNQSAYLGQMKQLDTTKPPPPPTLHPVRNVSSSVVPQQHGGVWAAVGPLGALSLDLAQTIVRNDVVRTVFNATKDAGHVSVAQSEEDHAGGTGSSTLIIGQALERAQIPVDHKIHLRHAYLFCPVQDLLDCKYLRDFTAIGVGFGLSDRSDPAVVHNKDKGKRLSLLDQVSREAKLCRISAFRQRSEFLADQFIVVDQDFQKQLQEPQQNLLENCPLLSSSKREEKLTKDYR
jgi:hypothetical protein